VRERQPDPRDPWLARAAASPRRPLQRGAKGRRDDDDAVRAGLTRPWSTGPVEGHINRLQRLTRQMVGRATRDRLQPRVLLVAEGQSGAMAATESHGSTLSPGIDVPPASLSPMRPG
jgi:hypothetical protein